MTVSSAQTPAQLVNSLLGAGVTVSNVTFSGGTGQRGSFAGGLTTTPIPFLMGQGIILTSGDIAQVPGPNTSGMTTTNASGGPDADLNAIIGNGGITDDCAVLEFDFTPLSDTIAFNYIFASEEYPEFACGDYNDIFGFLLSGPNPAGGSYVKKNLAVIPGTSTMVSVNAVNPGVAGANGAAANCNAIDPNWASYSYLYHDNPKNAGVINIKCDGYTSKLTAGAKVVCGQSYHIKMAICDGGSNPFGSYEWDSYVFIEAGSFVSPGITTSTQVQSATGTLTAGSTITEGCTKGVVTFTATPAPTTAYTVNYTITGTATNGTDYTTLTGSVTIPANAGTATITIDPLADGIADNGETVIISASNCVGSTSSTFTILDGAAPLVISCGTTTSTSVQFLWNAITGASSYNYSYTVNGGTAVVSSTNSTSLNITPLNPGDVVSITVTPVGSTCPVPATWTCTATSASCSINAGLDKVICKGASTTLTTTPSGTGTPTYSWTASQGANPSNVQSPTVSPTITTSYTVVVTYGSCTASDGVLVTVNTVTPEAGVSPGTITCTTTSLNLNGSGGGNYSWSATNGGTISANGTSANPSISSGGTYTVTVTGTNGCTATDNVVVLQDKTPPTMDAGLSPGTITCTTTSLNLNGSGGGAYNWAAINGGVITSGSTTNAPNISNAGTYNLTVTGANGCTASDYVNVIKDIVTPIVTITAPAILTCTTTSTNMTASGGNSYLWSAGTGGTITSAANGATITVTAPAVYTVTVTGANGCVTSQNQTVTSNTTLPIPEAGTVSGPITCTTPSLNLNGSGGVSYNWVASNGGTISANGTTASPTITSGGTYTVTVTGPNGCSATDNVIVLQNTTAPIPDAGQNQVICSGTAITLTATSTPTTGVGYLWSTGGTTSTINVTPTNTTTATIVLTYTVTVTNTTNGCKSTDNVTVTVNPNPNPTITAAPSNICEGQSTMLTVNGGTSWSWSDGGSSSTISVSPTVNTVYSVTVTDGNGCKGTKDISVNVQTQITASATPDAICIGESAVLTTSGGTSYLWSNGATSSSITVSPTSTTNYGLTVTNNLCSAATSVTLVVYPKPAQPAVASQAICPGTSAIVTVTNSATGLSYSWSNTTTANPLVVSPTGNTSYTVTVTDGNGCTNTNQVAVILNPVPTANAGSDVAICAGTSTQLSATGGQSYKWNTGPTTAQINVSPATTTQYTVTATNAQGCTDDDQVQVTVKPLPVAGISPDIAICAGTSTQLTATGGGTYTWSNGNTTQTISASPSQTITYKVTVTLTGCTATEDVVVTVKPLPTPSIVATSADVCTGQSTDLTVSGGTSYLWSTSETTPMISVVPTASTTYTVTATTNGCTATASKEIVLNDDVTLNLSNSNICIGNSASLSISVGTDYIWSNGATTSSITVNPSATTNYSVTVSDANDCSASTTVTVNVHPLPVVELGNNPTICSGASTNLSPIAPSTTGVSYQWSNSETSQQITVSPMITTTYSLVVSDNNTCTASNNITVNVNLTPVANAGLDQDICEGDSAQLGASGGTVYSWNNASDLTNSSINNPKAGPVQTTTYSVTVSANGCMDVDQMIVNVNPIPSAFAGFDESICAGTSTQLTAVGGTSYHWSNSANTATTNVSPNTNTTYSVTVTASGCTSTDEVSITVVAIPVVSFASDTIAGCEPLLVNFSDSTQPSPYTYLWDFGDGAISTTNNPSHLYTNDGVFDVKLTVTNLQGCQSSYTNNNMISVYPQPNIEFDWTPDFGDIFDGKIEFHSITSGGVTDYDWTFGDTISSNNSSILENPNHKYINAGYYDVWLVGTTQFGCADSIMHTIRIKDLTTFYIPNAFTPTGNDLNETFGPIFFNCEFDTFEFSVYDRWGGRVFSTTSPDQAWDGRAYGGTNIAKSDVYVWQLKYKEKGGSLLQMIGKVTLVN